MAGSRVQQMLVKFDASASPELDRPQRQKFPAASDIAPAPNSPKPRFRAVSDSPANPTGEKPKVTDRPVVSFFPPSSEVRPRTGFYHHLINTSNDTVDSAENAPSSDHANRNNEEGKADDADVEKVLAGNDIKINVVTIVSAAEQETNSIASDSSKSTRLSTSSNGSGKQLLNRPVPKPRTSLWSCTSSDGQKTASERRSESTLPSSTYSCISELQDVVELSEHDTSSVFDEESAETIQFQSSDKLSSTERKVAVVVPFSPSVDESPSEPREKEKFVTCLLDGNKECEHVPIVYETFEDLLTQCDKIPPSQHSPIPIPCPLPRSPKLKNAPNSVTESLYIEADLSSTIFPVALPPLPPKAMSPTQQDLFIRVPPPACKGVRIPAFPAPAKPPPLPAGRVILPTVDGRDSLFGVPPVPGSAAASLPGDGYIPPTVSHAHASVAASGPYIQMNKGRMAVSSDPDADSSPPPSPFPGNLVKPTLAHGGQEPSPPSPLMGSYSEDEYDESSLYETEPLYQFYTDRVLAFNVLEAVDCASDDEGEYRESVYEDISVRMKSVIKRMSVGRDLDDTTKLSSMLSNIAKTCAGAGARRLWADMPKVKECGILETMSSCEQRLQECLFEIITSETSYVKSLDVVLSHFMKAFHDDPAIALSRTDFRFLFSNLEAVVGAAHRMHKAVEAVWNENCLIDPARLCSVVEKIGEEIADVYVNYCRNAVYQERKLQELNKNLDFVAALASLEDSPEAHGLTLQSFLVLPMQRVTRMPMLVDAVWHRMSSLKAGEGSRVPGDVAVQSCLAAMQQIAAKCNEAARLNENLEQLNAIHTSLIFKKDVKTVPIVSSERFLVKKGELMELKPDITPQTPRQQVYQKFMRTVKNLKDTSVRHLFLFNNLLLIAKKKKDQFEVLFHTPVNKVVGAFELADEVKARTLPHGAPSGCQNLFLLTIMTDAGVVDHIWACKQSSDMTRWIEAFTAPVNDNQEEKLYNDPTDCPQVQVVGRFVPSEPDELELLENDVINVIRKCPDGWYLGERLRDGKRGWFPQANTIEIENQHVRMRNLRQQLRMQRPSRSNDVVEVVDPTGSPSNRVRKISFIKLK